MAPLFQKVNGACFGGENAGFEAFGIELREVGFEIGEHGGCHGGAGDVLLHDELCCIEVFYLPVGDSAHASAGEEGCEEGLDAHVEGEVECLQASVVGLNGDAGLPERVDEGCEVAAGDAHAFGGAGAAGGEEYVGEVGVVGWGNSGCGFVGGRERGGLYGFDASLFGLGCEVGAGGSAEECVGVGLLQDVEVSAGGLQGVEGDVGEAFEPECEDGGVCVDVVVKYDGERGGATGVRVQSVAYGGHTLVEGEIGVGFASYEESVVGGVLREMAQQRSEYLLVE